MFTWLVITLGILLMPTPLFEVFLVPFLGVFTVICFFDSRLSKNPVCATNYLGYCLYLWGSSILVLYGMVMVALMVYVKAVL